MNPLKTAKITLVVNLESEKIIFKTHGSDEDDKIYGLKTIRTVDPIKPLEGEALDSAFSLKMLH